MSKIIVYSLKKYVCYTDWPFSKYLDLHLKPFRCKVEACASSKFASTAVLLRHDREAHGMHSYSDQPYLCQYSHCERSRPGNGFPGRFNLFHHMKRVHDHKESPDTMLMCPYDDCKQHTRNGFTRKENLNEHISRCHSQDVRGSFEEFSDLGYTPNQMRNVTPPLPMLSNLTIAGSTSIPTPWDDSQTSPLFPNSPGPDDFPADEWFPLFPDENTSTHQIVMHPGDESSRKRSTPITMPPVATKHSNFTDVNAPKRRKPLPPVVVDETDAVALKRARNTAAARKSRDQKVMEREKLEKEISDLKAEVDFLKAKQTLENAEVGGHDALKLLYEAATMDDGSKTSKDSGSESEDKPPKRSNVLSLLNSDPEDSYSTQSPTSGVRPVPSFGQLSLPQSTLGESVLVPFLNSAYPQASHQPEDLALQSLIEWEDQSLPTLDNAPTMTDEGYHSMTKQGNSEIGEKDAVSDADSVRTDNRDSGLPQNVKEQLSTYFAQEILDNIQLANDELANAIDDICFSLPELLREFSTLVENHARPGLEERACIFVRHQRNQIARNLRTILSSKPDGSDTPAARDRIDLLWGEHHNIDENPDDRVTADLAHEIKDPSESLLNLPEIPEARAFLIESFEYKWLLSRIRSMVKTMPTSSTDSDIRRDLIGLIGGGHTIQMELDWHFASFLDEQYENPDAVELQQVLCCSGVTDNAYVAPSVEYADLLWPRLGKEMILCLSRGLRKGSVRMSGMLSKVSRKGCS